MDLWLSTSHLNHLEEGDCSALSDSLMILFYNIVDLVQLKVRFPLIILVSVVFVRFIVTVSYFRGISSGFHGTVQ